MVLGVTKIREAGLPFGFYCTVTTLNIDRLEETAELATTLGANWIKFNHFLLAGPGLGLEIVPGATEITGAGKRLKKMSESDPGFIQGSMVETASFIETIRKRGVSTGNNSAFHCGGGSHKITVFPDGTVTPCDHLPDYSLGNILERPLIDILHGEEMKRFTAFVNQPKSSYRGMQGLRSRGVLHRRLPGGGPSLGQQAEPPQDILPETLDGNHDRKHPEVLYINPPGCTSTAATAG